MRSPGTPVRFRSHMATIDTQTDYEIGRDNIQFLGLDVHNPVFAVASLTIIGFVVGVLAFRDDAAGAFNGLYAWLTSTFDWVFMGAGNLFVLFCLLLVATPLGRVRLGGPDARPDYSAWSWFAMLFAAGIGIGLMFFGVAEPIAHLQNPPLGVDAADTAAAHRLAIASAIFHWGVHPWAMFAVVALALAFAAYNLGLPLTLRSAFYPILGKAIWGRFGHLIDVLAVFAALFGLATSLGLGAEQTAAGLAHLFGVPATDTTKVLIIAAITFIAMGSVVAGMDRGVKRLSQANLLLALLLLAFVLAVGPTSTCWPGSSPASATISWRSDRSATGWVVTTSISCTGGPRSSGRGGSLGRPSSACSSPGSRAAARCANWSAACWSSRCWCPRSG